MTDGKLDKAALASVELMEHAGDLEGLPIHASRKRGWLPLEVVMRGWGPERRTLEAEHQLSFVASFVLKRHGRRVALQGVSPEAIGPVAVIVVGRRVDALHACWRRGDVFLRDEEDPDDDGLLLGGRLPAETMESRTFPSELVEKRYAALRQQQLGQDVGGQFVDARGIYLGYPAEPTTVVTVEFMPSEAEPDIGVFVANMVGTAEVLARDFAQEMVIVAVDDGRVRRRYLVSPKGAPPPPLDKWAAALGCEKYG